MPLVSSQTIPVSGRLRRQPNEVARAEQSYPRLELSLHQIITRSSFCDEIEADELGNRRRGCVSSCHCFAAFEHFCHNDAITSYTCAKPPSTNNSVPVM